MKEGCRRSCERVSELQPRAAAAGLTPGHAHYLEVLPWPGLGRPPPPLGHQGQPTAMVGRKEQSPTLRIAFHSACFLKCGAHQTRCPLLVRCPARHRLSLCAAESSSASPCPLLLLLLLPTRSSPTSSTQARLLLLLVSSVRRRRQRLLLLRRARCLSGGASLAPCSAKQQYQKQKACR